MRKLLLGFVRKITPPGLLNRLLSPSYPKRGKGKLPLRTERVFVPLMEGDVPHCGTGGAFVRQFASSIFTAAFFLAMTVPFEVSAAGVNYNETTALPLVTSSDVVGQFTSCTGVQYLGADGACHDVSGSGLWSAVTGGINYGSGNVGIGTTSPDTLLHIASGGTTDLKIEDTGGTIGGWRIRAGNANANDFSIGSGNFNSRLTIDSSGNVGIGTTSPDGTLHVYSTNPNLQTVLNMETPQNSWQFQIGQGYGTATGRTLSLVNTGTPGDFQLRTTTSGNSQFTILGNGNVGIGTTSPGAKLHIQSSGFVASRLQSTTPTSGNVIQYLYGGNNGYAALYFGDENNDSMGRFYYKNTPDNSGDYLATTVAASEVMRIDVSGNVGIGETNPSSKLHVLNSDKTLTLEASASGYFNSFGFNSGNPYMTYYAPSGMTLGYGSSTGAAPTVDTMFLSNTGNVGIGTTSPGSKLTLGSGDLLLANNGQKLIFSDLNATITRDTSTNNMWIRAGYAGGGNYEGLRITQSGDIVGGAMGNSNNIYLPQIFSPPSASTQTYNTINIEPTINQTGGSGGITRSIYINPTLTSAYDWRAIEVTKGNVLFGTTSGNVGIGTTSPTSLLDVAGDIHLADMTAPTTTTNKLYSVGGVLKWAGQSVVTGGLSANSISQGDSSVEVTDTGTNGTITMKTDNAARMTIDKDGNVGIGTTSPQAGKKMDVRSDSGTDGAVGVAAYGYNGNGGMAILANGYASSGTGDNYGIRAISTGSRASGTNIGGYFSATGASNNYALITGSGNVGIGVTNPTKKLDVDGGARFSNTSSTDAIEVGSGKIYWDSGNGELVIQVN